MKKPALVLTSALLLSLALTACGGGDAPAESAAPSAGPAVSAAPAESALPASGDATSSATPADPGDAISSATPADPAAPEAASGGLYVPGTYTGVGEGYNGPVTLEVEVSGSAILAVTVVSHSDSEGVIQNCTEKLLPLMVEANSADVAPISGATLTSDGYKGAVRDALTQAAAH